MTGRGRTRRVALVAVLAAAAILWLRAGEAAEPRARACWCST